jgi:hypothetical protein
MNRIRTTLAWSLTIVAVCIAIPAQLLMFLAEAIGDKADEFID